MFDSVLVKFFQNYPIIIFLVVIVSLIGLNVWNWAWRYYDFMKTFNKLPRYPYIGYPHLSLVLGNLDIVYYFWYLSRSKAGFHFYQMSSLFEDSRLPGLLRVKIFFVKPLVIIFKQNIFEQFFKSSANIKKSEQYRFLEASLGTGLVTSNGEQWRRHRKFLTPTFHFKILESFVPIMNKDIGELVRKIERMIDENPEQMLEKGVDVRSILVECTMNTFCSTSMGVSVHSLEDGKNEFVESLKTVEDKMMLRLFQPHYYSNFIFRLSPDGRENARSVKTMHRFVNKIIADRKVEIEKSIRQNDIDLNKNDENEFLSRKRNVFLDSLLLTHLRSPKEFTMKNILDEVNTFMAAGHDTTSTSIYFSLLLIASDQRVQEKLHEEMDSMFGSDHQRPITAEDCRSMKYLEMCIKESLRLFPSIAFVAREIVQEFSIGKYTVPVGCTAILMISLLHQDPEVFPSPQRFIPERFEPNQPIHRMPYAYIPFFAGPRNCIGQKFAMLEMKIMLASILRCFLLSPRSTIDDLDTDSCIVFRSNSPIMISFKRRQRFS